jgi:hypothetical protein
VGERAERRAILLHQRYSSSHKRGLYRGRLLLPTVGTNEFVVGVVLWCVECVCCVVCCVLC